MADNRQMIIDLDKKRMTAMAQRDIATLNGLLGDDLVYTHSSARLDTKQSLIGNMESGATVYTAVEPSDVNAQDLGDTVVLTGSCRISVMSGGRPTASASGSPTSTPIKAGAGRWWPGSPRAFRNNPPRRGEATADPPPPPDSG
jgi:hypothetical protein